MRALNRKILRDLRRMRGQVLALSLVLASGVAMVVMSQGLLASLRDGQVRYYAQSRFADVFVQLRRAPEHAAERLRSIPGVSAVETRVVATAKLEIDGVAGLATARMVSLPGSERALNQIRLRAGRLPAPGHGSEGVVNEAFAEATGLHPGGRIAAIVEGRRLDVDVVGVVLSPEHVYSIAPGQIFPDDRRFGVVWMGRDVLAAATDMEGAFDDASLLVAPGGSEREIIEQVDAVLSRYGGLGAYGRSDHASAFFVANELDQLRTMGLVAPAVFLVVAAFLVHVVLSRLIGTQREQIAALKAFGYGDGAVGFHYLGMVLVIVGIAVALGTVAGVALAADAARQYQRFFRLPEMTLTIPLLAVLAATAVAALTGVSGALAAVRRATRLPPAEAMRPEPPPTFRRTLVERLGVERFVPPSARMVLRELERRWLRASLSVVGLSLAVAILVVSPSIVDALDLVLVSQFERAQRQDLTVGFAHPRTRAAIHELERMPGVLRAEPFRVVPVRLRSGHRSERVALTGIGAESELWRVLDRDGHVVRPPPAGLLLGAALARELGATDGATVEVEVLEGSRVRRDAVVAGSFDEDVGLSAVMSLEGLGDLLREGDAASGAHLAIDSAHAARLQAALEASPGIAVVSSRRAAMASFQATLQESMLRMTTFNILFGAIIACGVVYNGARIALAQRERELASLRVLGFRRSEVSAILLGEQAVLTLLSIPLGFGLGYAMTAGMTSALQTKLYRVPLVAEPATYAWAAIVVIVAAIASALLVRREVDRLDLVAVLKSRD